MEYFGLHLFDYSLYEKKILGSFVYLFISKVTTGKVNFRSYKQRSQGATRLICSNQFLSKMLVSFFNSNIPLYIEENFLEVLCKVIEMELKTYTPVGKKLIFQQIKFKVLHYIQHNFIR